MRGVEVGALTSWKVETAEMIDFGNMNDRVGVLVASTGWEKTSDGTCWDLFWMNNRSVTKDIKNPGKTP